MKKIGILGSGAIAHALGKDFTKYGYEVMFGTRDPSKMGGAKAGGFGGHRKPYRQDCNRYNQSNCRCSA